MRTPPSTPTKDNFGQELRKVQDEISAEKIKLELLQRERKETGAWITSVRNDADDKLMDTFHIIMEGKKQFADTEENKKRIELEIFKFAAKISLQQSTIERNTVLLKKQKEESEKMRKEFLTRQQEVRNVIKELEKLTIQKKKLLDEFIKTNGEIESKTKEKQKIINEIVLKKIEITKQINNLNDYKEVLERRERDLEIYKGRIHREFEKVFPGHKFIIL